MGSKNEGGNIIWKSIPDTKDDRGVVKRIDIIIPNRGGGVKEIGRAHV